MNKLNKKDWKIIIENFLTIYKYQYNWLLNNAGSYKYRNQNIIKTKIRTQYKNVEPIFSSIHEIEYSIGFPLKENWKINGKYQIPTILTLFLHYHDDLEKHIDEWHISLKENEKTIQEINIDFLSSYLEDKYSIASKEIWKFFNHFLLLTKINKKNTLTLASYLNENNWEEFKELMNSYKFTYLISSESFPDNAEEVNTAILFEMFKIYFAKEKKDKKTIPPLFIKRILLRTTISPTKEELLTILMDFPFETTKDIFKYHLEKKENIPRIIELCRSYLENNMDLNMNLFIDEKKYDLTSRIIKMNLSTIKRMLNYHNETTLEFLKRFNVQLSEQFKEQLSEVRMKIEEKNNEVIFYIVIKKEDERKIENISYIIENLITSFANKLMFSLTNNSRRNLNEIINQEDFQKEYLSLKLKENLEIGLIKNEETRTSKI